jgi:hypothetical protein
VQLFVPHRVRVARGLVAILSVSACVSMLSCTDERHEPWQAVAARIEETCDPDSTAVLVLFDRDLFDYVRSRLPKTFEVIPFRHPDVPRHDAYVPAQLGRMFREASAATQLRPVVWVVGRRTDSPGRKHAARFADMVASSFRRLVFRETVDTFQGTLEVAWWADQPGGVTRRVDIARALAWADSVKAVGVPKPTPITRPFSRGELEIDQDTLSLYMAKLPDTSFYSIGGCSEVEITFWNASERLGGMGPGVVPVLIDHVADPNSFVRERVQEALQLVTQDERILARTGGEYITFYDKPGTPAPEIAKAWWARYRRFWAPLDTVRPDAR